MFPNPTSSTKIFLTKKTLSGFKDTRGLQGSPHILCICRETSRVFVQMYIIL